MSRTPKTKPLVQTGQGATPKKNDRENEIAQLSQKELLTVSELAIYAGISERNIRQKMLDDDNFPKSSKLYGRVYFKRSAVEPWLAERNKKLELVKRRTKYLYTVTKFSTGETFILEATHSTHARRLACKADGVGDKGLKNYGAIKIKESKGDE